VSVGEVSKQRQCGLLLVVLQRCQYGAHLSQQWAQHSAAEHWFISTLLASQQAANNVHPIQCTVAPATVAAGVQYWISKWEFLVRFLSCWLCHGRYATD
jgi:hypothetical protein